MADSEPSKSSSSIVKASSSSTRAATKVDPNAYDTYEAAELGIVLSYFDLGRIEEITPFLRGSRRAPKLVIKSEKGEYLLKRRAKGKDDPFKVAFCHQLQLHLADKQFPLPHLIGTISDNNSMLQYEGTIYEMFEYIQGENYDYSLDATADSGRILGLFHKLLIGYEPDYEPPRGSYHNTRSIAKAINHIPNTLRKLDPQGKKYNPDMLTKVLEYLHAMYNEAAMRVNEKGIDDWPRIIIHTDWHPGNVIYRGTRIVAVIDYDTARLQQRVIDIANGALQFSITGGGDNPSQWPDNLDVSRFVQFMRGYDSVYSTTPEMMLSIAELQAIPWLMIEALIAEAVIPIANTGSFAKLEGSDFLNMVARKSKWLKNNAVELIAAIEG